MRYGSLCSGIEAATVAWHPLGWEPAFFSEIESFCNAVLKHHYPGVKNLGDMTKFKEWPYGPESVDLVVGGTPCQSFSIAGLREGLADPRGNLALVFLAVVDRLRPRWVVWENVPSVLSSWSDVPDSFKRAEGTGKSRYIGTQTNDFDTFTRCLGELGYGVAWRTLDAQYFGVPQRRRRVFVVGYLGDWRPAAAVLFERHCLSGNPPPRREKGEGFAADVVGSLEASGRGTERTGESRGQDPVVAMARTTGRGFMKDDGLGRLRAHPGGTADNVVYENHGQDSRIKKVSVAPQLNAKAGTGGNNLPLVCGTLQASGKAAASATQQDAESGLLVAHSLRGDGFDASEDGTGRGTPLVFNNSAGDTALGLSKSGAPPATNSKNGPGNVLTIEVRGRKDRCNLEYREDGTANALRQPNGGRGGLGIGAVMTPTTFKIRQGCEGGGKGYLGQDDKAFTVARNQDQDQDLFHAGSVRRLTPRECERLQGFPDDYTLIPYRGKPAKDGPRYRAMGNSMAVPVMRWIGLKIQIVDGMDGVDRR